MSVLNGYGKYKRYVKKDTGYQLCSHWTSSNTVHFDDGNTAQTKLGAINGITDSLTATSSNVALSSKAGNSLQNQINTLNTGIEDIIALFEPKFSQINTTNIPGSGYWGNAPGGWKRFTISGRLGIALTANQERVIYTNVKVGATYTALSKVIPITRSASPILASFRISVGGEVSITPYSNVPTTQSIIIDETYF